MTDLSPDPQASRFLPKIVTVWREGYGLDALRADALAGLTVAIVALPLSMAIVVASGVSPDRGVTTAIVGGFLVSLLGGSRYQIGGPAGAFIVLVSACVMAIGVGGLLTATPLSGGLLLGAGLLRLGGLVRFVPYPVTLGFTAGIAVIILASQLRDFAGLRLPGAEPGPLLEKLTALWSARETLSGPTLALAAGTVLMIVGLRRWRPRWPVLLLAVVAATLAALLLRLPVETIGSRFGALPNLPPFLGLPDLSPAALTSALPWAASFALLGAIESLLSAVVAESMGGGRLRPDAELVAQGVANIGASLFGGFCVTGTIARTATNVRAGSRGPVSGMLHALILLAVMAVGAPLAGPVPLAALAAVLVVVAWGMAERHEIGRLIRLSRPEAAVVAVSLTVVVLRDLTEGIAAGIVLAGLFALARMAQAGGPWRASATLRDGMLQVSGPLTFWTAGRLLAPLEAAPGRVDLSAVTVMDLTGARRLAEAARRLSLDGKRLQVTGARPEIRAVLAGLQIMADFPGDKPDHPNTGL